jgi:hypothetical protein
MLFAFFGLICFALLANFSPSSEALPLCGAALTFLCRRKEK